MNNDARLLAARLLEAEPEVPPDPQTPNPASTDVRDFILTTNILLNGVPEPHYYAGLEEKLEGRAKLTLEGNTFLVRLSDTEIAVRLHATNIITAQRDGLVTVTTFGTPNPKHQFNRTYHGYVSQGYGTEARSWRSVLSMDRLNKHLPCGWRIYTVGGTRKKSGSMTPSQGQWYWSNHTTRTGYSDGPPFRIVFSDGDQIDTHNGKLTPQAEPVPSTAKKYTRW